MSLQYRAIWRDGRPDLIETGRSTFQEWINSKSIDLLVPGDGVSKSDANEVVVDAAVESTTSALRIRLNEDSSVEGGEERWTTTVHWMRHNHDGWVWVDVEWVSDVAFAHPPEMAAPRLVRTLLTQRMAKDDRSRLGPTPSRVGTRDVTSLIEWIFAQERAVPVVVYSVDQTIRPEDYAARIREAASRLAGCADVRMLTAESEPAFNETMAQISLSVFQGAVRVYLPGLDEDDPQPWRHRYTRARYLSDNPYKAANPVVRQILPRMVSLQPPEVYRMEIKHLLDRQRHDWEAIAEEFDEDNTNLNEDIRRLQREKEQLQLDRDIAYEEAIESEREASRTRRRLIHLRNHVRSLGEAAEEIEEAVEEGVDPTSCMDAIDLAQELQHVVIHPKAARDIARMDESPESELWAQRIYRHLQSLDAYARDKTNGFVGSFKEWCANSGSDFAISSKFIAMTESEWVKNNERFRSHRRLPIDPRVVNEGEIEMLAHLKPVEGGGQKTIPRIYFHDDTMGATKSVHIGFIGPHDLMPNKSTN